MNKLLFIYYLSFFKNFINFDSQLFFILSLKIHVDFINPLFLFNLN